MSALWTQTQAADATSGTAIGEWAVTGLSIDTRSIQPGDLFIPLKDIRDGHEFIPMAYEKGAAAVISELPIDDAPALLVSDSLKALEDLARVRAKTCRKIGVTGSVGKTSVKEMIAVICKSAGPTHASIKSYNNHWGVPLTMASMPANAEYTILEMGMNHAGELDHLSKMVRPDIAVITKVAPAHLAHFASVDDIAKAKAEIFAGMPENGVGIVPANTPFMSLFANAASGEIKTFGYEEGATARILDVDTGQDYCRIKLSVEGTLVSAVLPFAGAHWAENAACALLAAAQLGVDPVKGAKALEGMGGIAGRGARHNLNVGGKTVTLIDESYNANPESMRAAIATLGLAGGRKVAVLGDMLELGSSEKQLHADLAAELSRQKIDRVLLSGPLMQSLNSALPAAQNAGWAETKDKCLAALINEVRSGDTIMIKGSNASGMGAITASLIKNYKIKEAAHAL